MTDWKVLLVKEHLRDMVQELAKVRVSECTRNPFTGDEDWTDLLRNNPHTAEFLLEDGRRAEVTFWCRYNQEYGDFYELPVELNEDKLIIVIK